MRLGGAKATVVIEEPGVDEVDSLRRQLEQEAGELTEVARQTLEEQGEGQGFLHQLASLLLPRFEERVSRRPLSIQQFIQVNIGDADKVNVGLLETDSDEDDS